MHHELPPQNPNDTPPSSTDLDPSDKKMLLRFLAPWLAATCALSIALAWATPLLLSKIAPATAQSLSAPSVVSFDVIKFLNAQRAVASNFSSPNSAASSEAAEIFAQLSSRTKSTIAEVAGPNTLVVLKQAIVQGQSRDITDAVLSKLGLPTDTPTQDATVLLDPVPTQSQLLYKQVPKTPTPSAPSSSPLP